MLADPNKTKSEALEVSVADLVEFLRKYFIILVGATLLSAVIGILYSFSMTKLYTAQTILLPEYSMGSNNSFFSMAMTQNTGAEKLVPDLYPNILRSVPFGQYLLKVPVVAQSGKSFPTLKLYLEQSTSPTIMSRVMSVFRPKPAVQGQAIDPKKVPDVLMLSSSESGYIQRAIGLINANVDTKNGIITLECEMEDPVIAAILVESSKKYLVTYVEEYRTSKTTEQVSFLAERVRESKKRQQNAELSLQSYRDRNRNAFLNVARIEEQRLQSDFTLAQSIYTDLSVKLEQAKLKVKEEKPVFKVLEPSKVPLGKSSPKRMLIGIFFALFGGFVTLAYIVFVREKLHLKLLQ